ncbi:MAG: aminoacetone oxidase family FAD-binding enzyme [Coriobacteriales bacterium]|jgi:predicted Rossmann fold flavoprotein|nr:aminoacetone oxidase family FAD-binding enzyme [Coriobacteriales bacterium]
MESQGKKVVIVGGGPAGLVASLVAAESGASVTVLESQERVGGLILKTGNGRCNLSNTALDAPPRAGDYHNGPFVEPLLGRIGCASVREAFHSWGLVTTVDAEGRVYPRTYTANAVLDVLREGMARGGVEVLTACEAVSVEAPPASRQPARSKHARRLSIVLASGRRESGDAVILACGARSSRLLGSVQALGHPQSDPQPVLGPLVTDKPALAGLDGVRARVAVRLVRDGTQVALERGEVLFRAYGVSGIVAFDLSRFAAPGDVLVLDLVEELDAESLRGFLARQASMRSSAPATALLAGLVHTRLAQAVLRAAGCSAQATAGDLGRDEGLNSIVAQLKGYRLTVTGLPGALGAAAQAMRGGLATNAFDPLTLASLHVPGLYAAGEALDVDGRCGGYNLHWAWASGMAAGRAASTPP